MKKRQKDLSSFFPRKKLEGFVLTQELKEEYLTPFVLIPPSQETRVSSFFRRLTIVYFIACSPDDRLRRQDLCAWRIQRARENELR